MDSKKRRKALYLYAILTALFFGCKVVSWKVLENPDWPHSTKPSELSEVIREKYAVGDVVIKPSITTFDGNMRDYEAFFSLYSLSGTSDVTIRSLIMSVNGANLDYGEDISSKRASSWTMGMTKPYYFSHISGSIIPCKKDELMRDRVNIVIVVRVTDKDGLVTEKKINANLVPEKLSYAIPIWEKGGIHLTQVPSVCSARDHGYLAQTDDKSSAQ